MRVRVRVEVPRGAFRKPRRGGRALWSPVPAPFDYGDVVGTLAADGDPQDALVLGRRPGDPLEGEFELRGVVGFVDAGHIDDKWVVGDVPTAADLRRIERFFAVYAAIKRVANGLRGRRGPTRSSGFRPVTP